MHEQKDIWLGNFKFESIICRCVFKYTNGKYHYLKYQATIVSVR